mgnify:CR=1 FL=1
MRHETKYNKLVGRIGDAYYFCDGIFKYDDSFQGATATVLEPVSLDEYEERTSPSGLLDYLGDHWKDAVADDATTLGQSEWCEWTYNVDGDEMLWNHSGYDLWDQLRDLGLSEEEYPLFTCSGGGRSFSPDMQFDEIYDPALWSKIQAVETKESVAV